MAARIEQPAAAEPSPEPPGRRRAAELPWSAFDLRRPRDVSVFLFPLAFFAANVALHRWRNDWYMEHVPGEDRLLENLQALAYLVAALVAASTARKLAARSLPAHALASGALAAASLVLLLEEVSFGQRLIGFDAPEWLRRRNLQGEANLHNLSLWHRHQGDVLLAISLAGAISWRLLPAAWLRAREGWLAYAVPGPETTLYFAQKALFLLALRYPHALFGTELVRVAHQELFETPFALAVAVHAWSKSRAYRGSIR